MKKNIKNSIWLMAIAITSLATLFVACNNEDGIMEDGIDNTPQVENLGELAAYAVTTETRSSVDLKTAVLTSKEIEWFNVNTREIRFNISSDVISERLSVLDRIEFRLGDEVLFCVDNLVNPTDSRTYFDLVLYYEWTLEGDEKADVGFFLLDCYPQQFADAELTVSNRILRTAQWNKFIKYLEDKGKLRQ